ncbi:MAG: hypothetical protein WDN00_00405 [Limisphaerales bacterium]
MADAGWLTGLNVVKQNDDMSLHFTSLGTARMKDLARLLKILAPTVFGFPPETPKITLQEFLLQACLAAPEIISKSGSVREANALIGLIGCYAKKDDIRTDDRK